MHPTLLKKKVHLHLTRESWVLENAPYPNQDLPHLRLQLRSDTKAWAAHFLLRLDDVNGQILGALI